MVAHRHTLSRTHTLNTHRQTHKKSPYVIHVKLIEQFNLIVLNYTKCSICLFFKGCDFNVFSKITNLLSVFFFTGNSRGNNGKEVALFTFLVYHMLAQSLPS